MSQPQRGGRGCPVCFKRGAECRCGADFSALIRADADFAVAGGVGNRRPCPGMPASPTSDHRVAYALYAVKTAAAGAFALGATDSEIEAACDSGRLLAHRQGPPK